MDEKKQHAKGIAGRLVGLARKNLRLIVTCVCVLLFLAILEDVYDVEAMKLDSAAYWLIVEHLRAPWLTPTMESFSALATPVTLVVLLLAIAAFAPGKRPGMCCAVNLVLVVAVNQALKFIIQRPRPDGFRLAEATGFSFPSGHSMVAMAFFGLLVWFVWNYERNRKLRCLYAAGFAFVIAMIGISRIYLGVHYASDVLGGFCLSIAWLAVYTRVAVPLFIDEDNPFLRPITRIP